MCTHRHWIYNKYAGRKILVNCGHCEACKQEKAAYRANRIRHNLRPGQIALFGTLTYAPDYLPYFVRSEFSNGCDYEYTLRRDKSFRITFSRSKGYSYKCVCDPVDLEHYRFDEDHFSQLNLDSVPDAVGSPGKISVCWYPDFQNFLKRLRIHLKRNFNYESHFSYFVTQEYGGQRQRAHFHFLLFIPATDEAIFRAAIPSCWPFADRSRTLRFLEVARDCASYVSSYVNGSNNFQSLLSLDPFREKCHFSKGFGCAADFFLLTSLLQKIDRCSLSYTSKASRSMSGEFITMPIPQYVVNRFFPRFKGSSWLDDDSLLRVLERPERIPYYLRNFEREFVVDGPGVHLEYSTRDFDPHGYNFTAAEQRSIFIRLTSAIKFYEKVTGNDSFSFAQDYLRAWKCLSLTRLRLAYDPDGDDIPDWSDFYDNVCQFSDEELSVVAPTLDAVSLFRDPNGQPRILQKSKNLTNLYHRMNKQKTINQSIIEQIYDY